LTDKPMKILVINDDGITSPGLWAAVRALRKVGEVFVLAPDRQQSGVGASLTLFAPVRVNPWRLDPEFQSPEPQSPEPQSPELESIQGGLHPVTAYSAEGTPGDCCILALENVVGAVDLVVSGVNSGSNVGWDVMVSGTVGGAVQGFVRGYSTIAISVASVSDPKYDIAESILELLGRRLKENPAPAVFLNVNIPNVAPDKVAGIRVTRLGNRSYGESVRQEGGMNEKRYWIARNRPNGEQPDADTDIWALKNNCVSITPLKIGLGDDERIPEVEGLVGDLPEALLARPD
jgi:5'-nucleotidase